jgi:hypothetical protein
VLLRVAELAAQLVTCTARLHKSASRFNAAPFVSPGNLDSDWQPLLIQINADNTPVRQRLDELEAAMSILCGSHTANRALLAAAADSPARSLTRLTSENWEPFLQSLLAIAWDAVAWVLTLTVAYQMQVTVVAAEHLERIMQKRISVKSALIS